MGFEDLLNKDNLDKLTKAAGDAKVQKGAQKLADDVMKGKTDNLQKDAMSVGADILSAVNGKEEKKEVKKEAKPAAKKEEKKETKKEAKPAAKKEEKKDSKKAKK